MYDQHGNILYQHGVGGRTITVVDSEPNRTASSLLLLNRGRDGISIV